MRLQVKQRSRRVRRDEDLRERAHLPQVAKEMHEAVRLEAVLHLVDQEGGGALVRELLSRCTGQPARAETEVCQGDLALEQGEVSTRGRQRQVQTGLQVVELRCPDGLD